MRRSTDRILTTHVGSLIRPAALLEHAARQQPQQLPRYQEAVRTAEIRFSGVTGYHSTRRS